MGATDEGSGKKGCGFPDLGPDILGGGTSGIQGAESKQHHLAEEETKVGD